MPTRIEPSDKTISVGRTEKEFAVSLQVKKLFTSGEFPVGRKERK